MNSLINFFFAKVQNSGTIRLFRKAIYLYLLIFTIIELPIIQHLYGESSLLLPFYKGSQPLYFFIDILNHSANPFLPYLLISLLIISIIISFYYGNKRWLHILIFISAINLYNKTAALQNAGTNLIMLILFFLIFVDEDADRKENKSELNILISNLAVLAIKFQIAFMYFVAGVYKLQGSHWLDGTALGYVFNLDEYTLPNLKSFINNNTFLVKLLTWLALTFQLLFPFLIWFKTTKKSMLILGTIFHLTIAFALGLFDFGMAMIASYTIFYSNERSQKLLNKLSTKKTNFSY